MGDDEWFEEQAAHDEQKSPTVKRVGVVPGKNVITILNITGQDIAMVTRTSLRKVFSVVAQDAQLFNGSLRENIEYGKLGSGDVEIIAAAARAGLVVDAEPIVENEEGGKSSPYGEQQSTVASSEGAPADAVIGGEDAAKQTVALPLDKPCGERGAKLSGGQQQRVSLARAILKDGTVFLLDEPTTGLDGVVAKRLQATMDELSKTKTTICITHHLEDLKEAHQILYLDEGRIVERGNYQELMELEGRFAEQVGARK